MELNFTKMQGCGNDYIYLDCLTGGPPLNIAALCRALSPRHLSVGADGIICVCRRTNRGSHATMRMYNADGTEGQMCGNGIRCVAQFLYEHGVIDETLYIDTPKDTGSPTKTLHRRGEGQWQVEMGAPRFAPETLPVVGMGTDAVVNKPLTVNGKDWAITCISMGCPHCVTFVESVATLDLEAIGPGFENHEAFPERTNTDFIEVVSPTHLKMRVWERGSGETWACGTGASASVAAACALGICQKNTDVRVDLVGGSLTIRVTDDNLLMTGPAVTVYEGAARL